MFHYFEIAGVLAVIVFSRILGHRSMENVFHYWREVEPREWATVVRHLRRRFPFNAIVTGQAYHVQEQRWRWRMPFWLRNSPEASFWFRSLPHPPKG